MATDLSHDSHHENSRGNWLEGELGDTTGPVPVVMSIGDDGSSASATGTTVATLSPTILPMTINQFLAPALSLPQLQVAP